MPEQGRNAIMTMVTLIDELEKLSFPYEEHLLLGGFTKSINKVGGGPMTIVVPDNCMVTVEMRIVPGSW